MDYVLSLGLLDKLRFRQLDSKAFAHLAKKAEAFGALRPKDRNAFTPNNLPALICGTVYYKNSKKIRYQCCTEHGIIKGTFGREQLDPLPHMDAKGIKVNYAALDKTN